MTEKQNKERRTEVPEGKAGIGRGRKSNWELKEKKQTKIKKNKMEGTTGRLDIRG
ncbi:hypothetical protein [Bacteroides sp.]